MKKSSLFPFGNKFKDDAGVDGGGSLFHRMDIGGSWTQMKRKWLNVNEGRGAPNCVFLLLTDALLFALVK